MPTICPSANLIFFPVPKVACTSLKVQFYELNNNVEWRSVKIAFGQVHALPGYNAVPFNAANLTGFENYDRITVIRNPVDRALSAYRDKARSVVLAGTKAEQNLISAGLPLEPSPELFFDEIDQYFECAPLIREHMRPFSYYIGNDLNYFDKIFRLEALDELARYVGGKIGRPLDLISSNSSNKSVNAAKPVSEKTLKKIVDFVAEDFDFLSDYYQK